MKRRAYPIVCLFVFLAAGTTRMRAGEETVTYRVVGLSHPEREEDLRRTVAAVPGVILEGLDFGRAEITLRCDAAQLMPGAQEGERVPPEKMLEVIGKRVSEVSSGTFRVTSRWEGDEDSLERMEVPVGLLDCKACRYAVYLAAAKIEGVARAVVDSERGVLVAWIDPERTGRGALVEALKRVGVDFPEN